MQSICYLFPIIFFVLPFCSFFQLISFCSYSPLLIICTIFHIFPLNMLFCLLTSLISSTKNSVHTRMVCSVSSKTHSYFFPKILFKNSCLLFLSLSFSKMNEESLMLDPFFLETLVCWKQLIVTSECSGIQLRKD